MELFYTLLGLFMFYAWIHSVVIVVQKTKGQTGYETFVLIAGLAGLAGFVLYLLGTM